MEQTVESRLQLIRRFFQFASPKEWAAATTVPLELAPDRFKTETLRMQLEAAQVAEALVDAGQTEAVRELLQGARTELLVPVVQVLARRRYQPAAVWLTREYRGRPPATRLVLLEYFSQVPAPSACSVVWEDLQDDTPAVREAAGQAMGAICGALPALAFLSQVLTGAEPPMAEAPPPEQVVQALIRFMPLEPGLEALKAIRTGSPPEYHGRVYRALHVLAGRTGTGETEGDTQRALLLLASQDWELSPSEERMCGIAFHRSARDERQVLLKAMNASAAVRVLAQGLSATGRKLLDQTLAHLERDRPELVPHLAQQMASLARRSDTVAQLRLLLTLHRHLPAEAPLRKDIPRQLVALVRVPAARPLSGQIVSALLSCEEGRALLANERLDGQVWEAVQEAATAAGRGVEQEGLVALVAEAVSTWAVLDTPRLEWILRMATQGACGLSDSIMNAIARAVSAHMLFAPDPTSDALLAALGRQGQIFAGIAPQLLRFVSAMPPDRQKRLLDQALALPDAHRIFGEGTLSMSTTDQLVLDCFVGALERNPEGAAGWLGSHPEGPVLIKRLMEWANDASARLRLAGEEQIAREQERRQTIAGAGVPLLERLSDEVDRLTAVGFTGGGAIGSYLVELEDGLFALAEGEPAPVPVPIASGRPVTDALSLRVMTRTLDNRAVHWKEELAAEVADSCGLALEKLVLGFSTLPYAELTGVITPIVEWLATTDLLPVEPALGAVVPYRSDRHGLWGTQAGEETTSTVVLTLGLALADGTVLRKALVSPLSTSGR